MKKALKYQLSDLKLSIIVYFAIIFVIFIFSNFLVTGDKIENNISLGLTSVVVCFTMGIAIFKEHLLILAQNGISRTIYFKSSLTTILILSLGFALTEEIITKCIQIFSTFGTHVKIETFTYMIFSSFFDKFGSGLSLILNLIITTIIIANAFVSGYLIAGIFYRIPSRLQVPCAIGFPAIIFGLIRLIVILSPSFWNKIWRLFLTVTGILSHNIIITIIFFLVLFLLISIGGFFIVKRTEIKN